MCQPPLDRTCFHVVQSESVLPPNQVVLVDTVDLTLARHNNRRQTGFALQWECQRLLIRPDTRSHPSFHDDASQSELRDMENQSPKEYRRQLAREASSFRTRRPSACQAYSECIPGRRVFPCHEAAQ